jgi:formate dehydrogenase subunit gamma
MAIPRDHLVLRFHRSERWLHWGLAVPFLVCLTTAAVLVALYNFSPGRPHRDLVSDVHKAGGVALIVLPIVALLGRPSELRVHFYNVRQAWGWTLNDMKWLVLLAASAVTPRVRLPEQGKFNAGEKLNFMAVMTSYPLFILTGILIWLPGANLLAWVAHVTFALAVAPLVIGHVYMALINPGTRKGLSGMVDGYVDREWAREHYREWYRESFGDDTDAHFGAAMHQSGAPEGEAPAGEGPRGPLSPASTRLLGGA